MLHLNWVTQQGSWLSNTVYEVNDLEKAGAIVQAATALYKDQQEHWEKNTFINVTYLHGVHLWGSSIEK